MWRPIIEADLLKKMSGAELDALRAAALGDGQADPIAEQIALATDLVRGYVATSGVDLGAAGAVPERLIGSTCDIIILDVMSRAAGTVIDPDDVRRKNASNALRLLERVADGRFSIDDPTTAEESATAAVPVYTPTRKRRFTRQSQDGI